jgi:hypothetical protein
MKQTILVVITAVTAAAQQLPSIEKMIAEKNWFFDRAVHPETRLIYSRVNLEQPEWWKKATWPAPEAVRGKANNDSEVPNLSNCAGAGGMFLGQLADIHAVTGDKDCIRQARTVFLGLKSLAEASPRKGFIARGLLPGDATRAHFHNSSVDQYTFYVYGLYKYFHSELAGPEEKAAIRVIMREICTMIERDGTILGSNGAPGWVSDIEAIRTDRSTRLLQMYAVAHAITGDDHWRAVYLSKLRESRYARLRTVLDSMQLRFTYVPRDLAKGDQHADISTIWQTQYSLVPLFELETDLTLKASWKEALSACSRIVRKFGGDGPELQIVLLAQNRDIVGPEPVTPDDARLHRELEGAIARLLSRTPRQQIDMPKGNVLAASMTHFGVTWLSAAETYWTAILRKVIRPGSEPPTAGRTSRP